VKLTVWQLAWRVGFVGVGVLATSVSAAPPARAQVPGQVIVVPGNAGALARHQPGGDPAPFFMAGPGAPEDFLYRGTRNANGTRNGDQQAIIDKLLASGANCLYLQAVRSHGGDGSASHNPFVDPANPSSGPDAEILDQWEGWFTQLDQANVVVYLFLYDDSAAPFGSRSAIGSTERAFVEGLVDRFEHHANLIWNVAEEYSEANTAQNASDLAAIIRAADDHDHIIGVHHRIGTTFDFPADPAIDQFAMQWSSGADAATTHGDVVTAVRAMLGNPGGRYHVNLAELHDHYAPLAPDRTHTRRVSWAVAMGGAHVMVHHMNVIDTPPEILADHGRLVSFFEQADAGDMEPNDELAFGDTQYLLADPTRHRYVAYASAAAGDLGVQGLPAGRYELLWFDAVTGASATGEEIVASAGDHGFARPPGIGNELALFAQLAPAPVASLSPWAMRTLALALCGGVLLSRSRRRSHRAG
jgi:hypothetical protein